MGDGAEKSSFPRLPVRCMGPMRVCPRREHEHAVTAVQRHVKAGAGGELQGDGGGVGRPGPPLRSRWGRRSKVAGAVGVGRVGLPRDGLESRWSRGHQARATEAAAHFLAVAMEIGKESAAA